MPRANQRSPINSGGHPSQDAQERSAGAIPIHAQSPYSKATPAFGLTAAYVSPWFDMVMKPATAGSAIGPDSNTLAHILGVYL